MNRAEELLMVTRMVLAGRACLEDAAAGLHAAVDSGDAAGMKTVDQIYEMIQRLLEIHISVCDLADRYRNEGQQP